MTSFRFALLAVAVTVPIAIAIATTVIATMASLRRTLAPVAVTISVAVTVSAAVVASVAGELRGVSDPARRLAQAGAVLGDPFDLGVAAAMVGLDDEAGYAALDELVAARVVQPADALTRLGFRHPLVRTAVLESSTPMTRLRLHTAAVTALRSVGASRVDIARHLVPVVGPGDVADAAALRAAGDDIRDRAPSIAADWYLAADRADPARSPARLADLAEVLLQCGRLAEALDAPLLTADTRMANATGPRCPIEILR